MIRMSMAIVAVALAYVAGAMSYSFFNGDLILAYLIVSFCRG